MLKNIGAAKRYIEQNPVEAKLADRPEDYAFSSASGKYMLDLSHFEGSGLKSLCGNSA